MIELILLQALTISIPLVFIIDFGNFVEKFKKWLYYRKYSKDSPYRTYDLKPFDCSACLSVWLYWFIWGTYTFMQSGQPLEYIYLIVGGFFCGLLTIAIRKYTLF